MTNSKDIIHTTGALLRPQKIFDMLGNEIWSLIVINTLAVKQAALRGGLWSTAGKSADAIIARDTNVFVADMLSQQNKNQCDQLGVNWVALRDKDGYKKFCEILHKLNIPHKKYNGSLNIDLPKILEELF